MHLISMRYVNIVLFCAKPVQWEPKTQHYGKPNKLWACFEVGNGEHKFLLEIKHGLITRRISSNQLAI